MILFDIGGVLIEYAGADKLTKWISGDVNNEKLNDMWSCSSAVNRFETGRCNERQFAELLVSELNLSVSPSEFIKEFLGFPKGFYPNAEAVLKEISQKYFTASFSNTNSLQWDKICSECGINKIFHKNFLSYKMGLMKPNKEAYIHVIKELGYEPKQVLFLDDNQANVDMGNEVGFKAYRVIGANELITLLNEMNILARF